MQNRIEKLITKQEPFCVIQYYSWLHFCPSDSCRCYEYLVNKKPATESSGGVILSRKMNENEIAFFFENYDKFTLKSDSKHGKAFEFMNFKKKNGYNFRTTVTNIVDKIKID